MDTTFPRRDVAPQSPLGWEPRRFPALVLGVKRGPFNKSFIDSLAGIRERDGGGQLLPAGEKTPAGSPFRGLQAVSRAAALLPAGA